MQRGREGGEVDIGGLLGEEREGCSQQRLGSFVSAEEWERGLRGGVGSQGEARRDDHLWLKAGKG